VRPVCRGVIPPRPPPADPARPPLGLGAVGRRGAGVFCTRPVAVEGFGAVGRRGAAVFCIQPAHGPTTRAAWRHFPGLSEPTEFSAPVATYDRGLRTVGLVRAEPLPAGLLVARASHRGRSDVVASARRAAVCPPGGVLWIRGWAGSGDEGSGSSTRPPAGWPCARRPRTGCVAATVRQRRPLAPTARAAPIVVPAGEDPVTANRRRRRSTRHGCWPCWRAARRDRRCR
jgi:hypothetical protein